MANTDTKINIIDINLKERPNITINISNNIIKSMLVIFYVHHDVIFNFAEKYQPQRLDEVLSKYSKQSRLVGEIEGHQNELSKYSKHSRSVEEIEDQYEEQGKYLSSQPEKTIAESVKSWEKKKRNKTNRNKN